MVKSWKWISDVYINVQVFAVCLNTVVSMYDVLLPAGVGLACGGLYTVPFQSSN